MITEFAEFASRRLLEFDSETRDRLADLQGKVFRLEIEVVDKELFFIPSAQGLEITDEWSGNVDISLRGSPIGLAQFALRQKGISNDFFADRKVVFEGDVDLAQDFQKIMGMIDIDFEEMLSTYVGDIAAHQVGRGIAAFREWAQDAGESLKRNTSDYLVEEARVLAPAWRVSEFLEQVDELRSDVDRVEQRVKRLREKLN